jgi:hypothetical protein
MSSIQVTNVSRWYGNVVAVNDVTFTLGVVLPDCSAQMAQARRQSCT